MIGFTLIAFIYYIYFGGDLEQIEDMIESTGGYHY
jgi:hypothetical protein